MFRRFTFLLIFNFVISDSTASVTLLITGHSSNNVYKHQLASFFVDSYEELIKGSKTPLFVFTNGVSMPVASEINNLLETWNDLDMPTNVSTLILTNLGTDEMSLDHLSVIQRFMKTKKPLIVIEIGWFDPLVFHF
ncbi:hypothetical protein NECAME_14823 [Necator americanus]|uniref:Glucuronosyltransferase n=1 Tax=Necator americanus TaxID=51031 RepID=W2SL65_NECAM|nr:hypothetical protein NECAME_14823 [Necator americanus]ETN70350.1 hypothetical protein NECAME_14823 [Necator americanus]